MAGNWIAGATSKHKGLFGRKAAAAGKSTADFAQQEKGAGGTLGKEANLASTLSHLNKGAHRKKFGASPFAHK